MVLALLEHLVAPLKESGTLGGVVLQGVLYQGGAERCATEGPLEVAYRPGLP